MTISSVGCDLATVNVFDNMNLQLTDELKGADWSCTRIVARELSLLEQQVLVILTAKLNN